MLIAVYSPDNDATLVDFDLDELKRLTEIAGASVAGTLTQVREAPHPATLLGSGKVDEVRALVRSKRADLVVSLFGLTPVQERNLSRLLGVRVIDRAALILDIFAQHARTRQSTIQVELAQLRYLLPRLAGRGRSLSRLGGGIGTRGPGETQLEVDRRRIAARIAKLKREVDQLARIRDTQRTTRARRNLPQAALVGYTNAGKSSLLNRLSGSDLLVADQLFATLDPAVRRVDLPRGGSALLQDTVGFIRQLPPMLRASFMATLEEIGNADVILHVVDASSPAIDEMMSAVHTILGEIGVLDYPMAVVFNKRDATDRDMDELVGMHAPAVAVSAKTGEGIDELLALIEAMLRGKKRRLRLRIPHHRGDVAHRVYSRCEVVEHHRTDEGELFDVYVPADTLRDVEPFVVQATSESNR